LVDRYLLDRFINEEGETCYSLCHDTLAPVVLLAHRHSERSGQRALRLLESRSAGIAQGSSSFKDADDIAALEAGRPFMRAWTPQEEAALQRGKEALDRDVAIRQSIFDPAKIRIEEAILLMDYDLAFQETKNVPDLDYGQDQLARLLEEIGFVFHASGKHDHAMEALQALTSLKLPKYAPLAAALPGIINQPAFHPLLETLQQIPDGAARLIGARYLPEMIMVSGGSFLMGSEDEQPIHEVTLDGFSLQKTPVTYWQYALFLQQEGLQVEKPSWGRQGNNPAVYVSWEDATSFCNWLSAMEGLQPVYQMKGEKVSADWSANGYRLPTEAEWEYAARGGVEQKPYAYSGSDDLDAVGWYKGNAANRTQPVAHKRPNTLGLYDMSGNVWEWCWDWYDEKYYKTSPSSNPKGPSTGSYRVLRGGSWGYRPRYCCVALRFYVTPGDRSDLFGFRLARTL
jgi:formylglycine-generating enzyme required for sulfatase activity